MSRFWLGVSNAIAAGIMLAASVALAREGAGYSGLRTALGALAGAAFIVLVRRGLREHKDFDFGALRGADARKAATIVAVMTAHSFTEGVGGRRLLRGRRGPGSVHHRCDRRPQHPRRARDQPRPRSARCQRRAGSLVERVLEPPAAAHGGPRVPLRRCVHSVPARRARLRRRRDGLDGGRGAHARCPHHRLAASRRPQRHPRLRGHDGLPGARRSDRRLSRTRCPGPSSG